MTSRANPSKPALRRHTLVVVAPERWRLLAASRDDLSGEPLIAAWADQGWPLIARRAGVGQSDGLALGLPLPPSLGKRRIAVVLQPGELIATRPPPLLDHARAAAPASWAETVERVSALAAMHGGPARVFGSLAWQWITGLRYLSASSDLDVLLPCAQAAEIGTMTASLAAIEADAPMRIDGELMRSDGACVNWREMHDGADQVLVKAAGGVSLVDRSRFLDGICK